MLTMNEIEEMCSNTSKILYVDMETAYKWIVTDSEFIMYAYVIPSIQLIGLIANIAFLYVIAKIPEMRSITNFFLANLAVSDILAITFVMWETLVHYHSTPIKVGNIWSNPQGCVSSHMIRNACFFSSICFITVTSVEKFLAVCFPLKHRVVNTKGRAKKLVVVCWLISFVLAGIVAPGHALVETSCLRWPENLSHLQLPRFIVKCEAYYSVFEIASDVTQVVACIIGAIINFGMYAGIVVNLSKRSAVLSKGARHQSDITIAPADPVDVRNRVAKMLVINGIVFYICITPFVYFNITDILDELLGVSVIENTTTNRIVLLAKAMFAVNSSVNPFVYSATNVRYREAFRKAFGGKRQKSAETNVGIATVALSEGHMESGIM
ncbi:growth hormone secretagogue receptor type 1-like [Amphiura filiformis]|uniref:growth hormone secretagogue receptor type 1-like n=1 Tax=Amphiura filiformis TaxID=82378 RepID=UPI003B217D30